LETITASYKLIRKIKDEAFDVDRLENYCLSIQIGIRDLQFCVVDTTNSRCLLVEDFVFQDVQTINTRLMVVQKLFENHHLLMVGFWHSIKISVKSHKFALVPFEHFLPEASIEYLTVNCKVKTKTEDVLHYKHLSSSAVNVFSADQKLVSWIRGVYKQKTLQFTHQGSALIEGINQYDDHSSEKSMFCYIDRGVVHLVVTQEKNLLYYNQFAVKSSEDFLKYVMLVFKELELSQKTSKLIIWGELTQDSPSLKLFKKYIRNVSLGGRPSPLTFSYNFDEMPDHQHFDVFSIYFCD